MSPMILEPAAAGAWLVRLLLAHAVLIPIFLEFPGLPFRFTTTDVLAALVPAVWLFVKHPRGFFALRYVVAAGPSIALVAAHWVALLTAQDLPEGFKEVVKLSGIMLFYLVLSNFLDEAPGAGCRLTWALILGATLVSTVAIGQFLQHQATGIGRFRAAGTLGNPNTLGSYLATLLPLAWGLMWTALSRRRRGWTVLALAGMIFVMGSAVTLTASRGALLSLLAAALVVAVAVFLRTRTDGRAKLQTWADAGTGIIITLAAVLAVSVWTSDTGSVADAPVAQRVRATTTLSSSGDRNRLVLLEAAWGMFLDHPLLGVGPGNYAARLPDYTLHSSAGRHEFPHNVVLHVAAEAGVVGLAAFLWWTGTVLAAGFRRTQEVDKTAEGRMWGLSVGAFAGVVASLVGALFGYPFVHGTWEPLIYCLALTLSARDGSPPGCEGVLVKS